MMGVSFGVIVSHHASKDKPRVVMDVVGEQDRPRALSTVRVAASDRMASLSIVDHAARMVADDSRRRIEQAGDDAIGASHLRPKGRGRSLRACPNGAAAPPPW
jgi:hypothetical protein